MKARVLGESLGVVLLLLVFSPLAVCLAFVGEGEQKELCRKLLWFTVPGSVIVIAAAYYMNA